MKTIGTFFCAISLWLGGEGSLIAATYTLSPTGDARIITIGPSFEVVNYRDDILSVYTNPPNIQRTLMRFDLSSVILAPGERIGTAVLTLSASIGFGGSGGKPIEVYRVLSAWDEATVTWRNRDADHAWLKPGADIEGNGGQPYTSLVANPQNGDAVNLDVRELVDQWAEEAIPNHGLLLKSTDGNGLTFAQDEHFDTNSRPKLTITTVPGPPRLRASLNSGTGEAMLSWRGIGVATLEEAAGIGATATWSNSSLPVTSQNAMSHAVAPVSQSSAGRYFRLRGN